MELLWTVYLASICTAPRVQRLKAKPFCAAFTIDWVKLDILPRAVVNSGTNLTLRCKVKVYHGSQVQLVQTFRFLQNKKIIYSKKSSDAVVEHNFIPARASNSGLYKCEVLIKERKKDSNALNLTVTGMVL